ncbi:MAG TPA: DUF3108 domain-containing protein, partial [Rhizomicrobium sp.]|nr:DUF3108 domain-containing protein [Rhizomicrobium sp.]
MLLASTPAFGEALPRNLDVSYSLTFWGITFGHIQYSDTLKGDAYAAQAHFETQGVVGFFWKSLIDAVANGTVTARAISPALYDSHSRTRDRPVQRVKIDYDNGDQSIFFDPPVDPIRFPVTREQREGAIDPMSGLISMLMGASAAPKTPCGAGVQVFDGRRRYDVRFTYVKDEMLSPNSGNAHLCALHFVPMAGYPQRLIM